MRKHRSNSAGSAAELARVPGGLLGATGFNRRALLKGLTSSALLLGICPQLVRAGSLAKASTSRDSYDEAVQNLPLGDLRDDMRAKLEAVIESPTLYRRLPVETIDCDPDLYVFLVRYPEVVVNMWQLMGITKVKMKRIAPYVLDAADGAGTVSKVELVYGTREKHVMYGTGFYEGPLLRRKVNGECVLFLQSGYEMTPSGRTLVSSQLDVFVTLENVGAEFVARTLHPLVGKTADHNFSESARFIAQISEQAELNQPGMQRLAKRLDTVADDIRERFSAVATTVNERAALRVAAYEKAKKE